MMQKTEDPNHAFLQWLNGLSAGATSVAHFRTTSHMETSSDAFSRCFWGNKTVAQVISFISVFFFINEAYGGNQYFFYQRKCVLGSRVECSPVPCEHFSARKNLTWRYCPTLVIPPRRSNYKLLFRTKVQEVNRDNSWGVLDGRQANWVVKTTQVPL